MAHRVRRNMSRLQRLEEDANNLEMHLEDASKNFLSRVISEARSDHAAKYEYSDVICVDLPRQMAQERKLARMRKRIEALKHQTMNGAKDDHMLEKNA